MAKKIESINPAALSLRQLAETKGQELVTKSTIFRVDPDLVEFEKGFNVRTADDELEAHIERLFLAMKEGAAIPPIDARVEGGRVFCVDGHCRTAAARRLKKEIPEYTLEARQFRGNEQDRILHMLGTGSGQKPLSPLEAGISYLRLVKFGMNSTQIAAKLGVSRVTVDNGLTLAEAPTEVQNLIREGKVSATQAREVVKQGPAAVEALKTAAAAPDAPEGAKGKKSTKKKVTAKKLKGTAAAKKPKKKAKKPAKLADDEIQITVKKFGAQAVLDKCRGIGTSPLDEEALADFLSTLEMALL